jgi:choline monooxygenase
LQQDLQHILASYNADAPLSEASTIPAPFYTDERIAKLEVQSVFSRTWQWAGRTDQVDRPGKFGTFTVAGEPIVVVRGQDNQLRAFFNVCRHHAAAVVTQPSGTASILRCPYHGWSYDLNGALKGTPEFQGVCNFDRSENGLVPIAVDTWENFVFVNLDPQASSLLKFLGGLTQRCETLGFSRLYYVDSRIYELNCNWKVFIDNYLDGGYHVPHLHKGLNSVLEYQQYTIENEDRYCLQSSPMTSGSDAEISAARRGDRAYYFWLYPNLMIDCYEGYMDTNLVIPLTVDRCRVIFDFYFDKTGSQHDSYNQQSIEVSNRVQMEDAGICEDVQRGLHSRAYRHGRLSVRREAGEHLFHRLLAEDLKRGLAATSDPK